MPNGKRYARKRTQSALPYCCGAPVRAVCAGADLDAVSGVVGITPHDLPGPEKLTGDIRPG
ncbi:hypothetical protein EAO72_11560 [Streptomyces sp. or43]|nr:hypothetical protein EAO72_11560 [Streptomyces sp. or43]